MKNNSLLLLYHVQFYLHLLMFHQGKKAKIRMYTGKTHNIKYSDY